MQNRAVRFVNKNITVSGNKVRVCCRLCIRHTTERPFALYLILEIARCYFHI